MWEMNSQNAGRGGNNDKMTKKMTKKKKINRFDPKHQTNQKAGYSSVMHQLDNTNKYTNKHRNIKEIKNLKRRYKTDTEIFTLQPI